MATFSKRALLVNTFGTFGYISCLLQWLFISLLYLPLVLDNKQLKQFLMPEKAEHTAPLVSTGPLSPLLIGFAIIFTVCMIALTVVMLVRAPLSIAKTGKVVTTRAAETVVPLIIHQPLTKKKQRLVTNRLVKLIKAMVVLIPFSLGLISIGIQTGLPSEVIVFASGILAIGSLVWFSLQYLAARWLSVPIDKLV